MTGRQTTHTRTSTQDGPDFCQECSERDQQWNRWPCADRVNIVTGHLCGHAACDNDKHRRRAVALLMHLDPPARKTT